MIEFSFVAPKLDAFNTLYDNASPYIELHNGRVFQVLADGPVADANGFWIVDQEATFQAHHDWLVEHPEEVYNPDAATP